MTLKSLLSSIEFLVAKGLDRNAQNRTSDTAAAHEIDIIARSHWAPASPS